MVTTLIKTKQRFNDYTIIIFKLNSTLYYYFLSLFLQLNT